MIKRILWSLLAVVVIVAIWGGVEAYRLSGAGKPLETKLAASCVRVDVAPGAEDIHYDPETGIAFISAENRRVRDHTNPPAGVGTAQGNGIYALDVSVPLAELGTVTKVSPTGWDDFRPHGIFLWAGEDEDGTAIKRLFVVNHQSLTGETLDHKVEIFDVAEGGALTHLESVAFPEMFSPNDVLAVGPRQFYASNDVVYREPPGVFVEVLFSLPISSAVYFDGEEGRTVAEGLAFGNGINISPDGKTVSIAEWTDHELSVYDRLEDNALVHRVSYPMPSGVDNLDVDPEGNVWFGGLSRIFDFIDATEDPEAIVDAVGVKVDPETGAYETVFSAHQGEISSASVAAVAGDKLLIGAVHDAFILACPLPENGR